MSMGMFWDSSRYTRWLQLRIEKKIRKTSSLINKKLKNKIKKGKKLGSYLF